MTDGNSGDSEKDYKVGRGKPPRHTQFKKGESGNPKGRKKGSKNFETIVRNTLNSRVTITVDGKKKRVSSQEALLEQLRLDAFKGDPRARRELLDLAQRYNNQQLEAGLKSLDTDDEALLESSLERLAEQRAEKEALKARKSRRESEGEAPSQGRSPEPRDNEEEEDDSWLG